MPSLSGAPLAEKNPGSAPVNTHHVKDYIFPFSTLFKTRDQSY